MYSLQLPRTGLRTILAWMVCTRPRAGASQRGSVSGHARNCTGRRHRHRCTHRTGPALQGATSTDVIIPMPAVWPRRTGSHRSSGESRSPRARWLSGWPSSTTSGWTRIWGRTTDGQTPQLHEPASVDWSGPDKAEAAEPTRSSQLSKTLHRQRSSRFRHVTSGLTDPVMPHSTPALVPVVIS